MKTGLFKKVGSLMSDIFLPDTGSTEDTPAPLGLKGKKTDPPASKRRKPKWEPIIRLKM